MATKKRINIGCMRTFSCEPRLNEKPSGQAECTAVREHWPEGFSFKIGHRWTFPTTKWRAIHA